MNGKRCDPKEFQYKTETPAYFTDGTVFRVWKPDNSEMHLRTFVVGKNSGHFGHCLKIRYYEPQEKGPNFERHHVRVQKAKKGPAKRSRSEVSDDGPLEIMMAENQALREGCWVNLQRSWDVEWNKYMVANCGWICEGFHRRLWAAHREQYL